MRGLLRPEDIDLVSPLSREECVRRLKESVRKIPFGRGTITGDIGRGGFRIQRAGSLFFHQILRAQMLHRDGSTQVSCRLGLNRHMFKALGILAISIVVNIVSVGRHLDDPDILGEAGAVFIFVALLLIYLASRLIRMRKDRDLLLGFLAATIEARPAVPRPLIPAED